MKEILEFLRILGASLMIQFPIVMCVLAGIIYAIGLKIGIFEEDEE